METTSIQIDKYENELHDLGNLKILDRSGSIRGGANCHSRTVKDGTNIEAGHTDP